MKSLTRTYLIKCLYIAIDVFFIWLAFYLACWMRRDLLPFTVTPADFFFQTSPIQYIFVLMLFSVVLLNNGRGLYQTRRELIESIEIWKVFRSVFEAGIWTIVAIYFFKVQIFPRSVILLSGALMVLFLSFWRMLKRAFVLYLVSRGYNNFNVILVGAGNVGIALAGEIGKRRTLGLNIVGYLDDQKPLGESFGDHRILGRISDLPVLTQKHFINMVFVTSHQDSPVFLHLLEQARDLRLALRVVPEGFELTTGEFGKYNIGFIPVLEYFNEGSSFRQPIKRIFDMAVSGILLVFLAPVLGVIALLIKRDSPGPVFYMSRRYGRQGREFLMCKFRSMVDNAEGLQNQLRQENEVDGPIFKIRGDPRVTRFGKILRKYSLDELPQLINVFKGEMSLVGPRPFPVEQIEKEDLRQLKRLSVRPGITGLWQIRGRSDISFARLIKWDIWYINNWSFWLDLNILLQTIPAVLKGKGAY